MTNKSPKRGLPPMHPGQLLREEILPALNRPKSQIAKPLGVSPQTLCSPRCGRRSQTPRHILLHQKTVTSSVSKA
jgi:antitoxin HigA-1